jgi:hypothetical protein
MGRFVEGEHRLQPLLLSQSLDDYLTEENPFGSLKYSSMNLIGLGFADVHPTAPQRPAYHPSNLLRFTSTAI